MKYRFLTVIIILIGLFSLTVSAAGLEFNISTDDSFIGVNREDDLTQISNELDMTADELNTYFNRNGIEYFAISKDTKSQIKISTFSNDFSKQVVDISLLDDAALDEFAKTFDVNSDSIIENNDRKFICVKSSEKSGESTYTVTQYITIFNNQMVYFTGYNPGENTTGEITAAFDTFELNTPSNNINLYLILIVSGIVIFSIVAVVMVIGIVKLRNSKEVEDIEE